MKISEAQTYGLTIRESATDGSDFTNPVADYRRLFLGEDGQLHVKDSAGTVSDIGVAGSTVATDAIWDAAGDLAVGSGANTAAKLTKGADGGVLAMGNGAVIWNAGTSFPASKATGDRYWRTDLGYEFYWDGTRWITTQVFSDAPCFSPGTTLAGGQNPFYWGLALPSPQTYWVIEFAAQLQLGATNDGSNYLSVDFITRKDDFSSPTTLVSISTAAATASQTAGYRATVGAVVDCSLYHQIRTSFVGTGSPSTMGNASFVMRYRIITT